MFWLLTNHSMRLLRRFFAISSFALLVCSSSYAGSLNTYKPPPMFASAQQHAASHPAYPHNRLDKPPKLFDQGTVEPSGLTYVPVPPKRPKTFYASASFVREMRKASALALPVERVYAEPLTEQPLNRVDGARLQEASAQDIWEQIQ